MGEIPAGSTMLGMQPTVSMSELVSDKLQEASFEKGLKERAALQKNQKKKEDKVKKDKSKQAKRTRSDVSPLN